MVNRSPASAIKFKTPEEVWSGNPPNYSNLRVFGCPAYAHVDEEKLEPRVKKYIFFGYASGVKGFRLWCPHPKSSKFIINRDVAFDEYAMINPRQKNTISSESIQIKDNIKQAELGAVDSNPLQDFTIEFHSE